MHLIDVDALMDKLTDLHNKVKEKGGRGIDELMCIATINSMPVIDAERVCHAHWVWKEFHGNNESWYQCSECDAYDLRETNVNSPYCWSCGAKMDEAGGEK